MTTHSTTLATWAGAIASTLEAQGFNSQQVFADAGLDIARTMDPNARYRVTDMTKLWHRCVAVTGDPAFGLSVPQHRSSTALHGMGMAIDASGTLQESLERTTKLSRLVSNVASIELYQREDKHWVVDWRIEPKLRRQVADEAMDAFLYLLAEPLDHLDLVEVHFIRAEPKDPSPWQKVFQCPIHFGSNMDATIISDAAMSKLRKPGNPALAQAGESVALDYLQQFDRGDVVLQVENEIRNRLQEGEPKQQDIAASLNLSVRQLQRKLAAQDTSFAQLLPEVRRHLAKEYLADSTRSIVDISLSLGFNDQSNFASAFRRWEGVSPSAYRESCKPS